MTISVKDLAQRIRNFAGVQSVRIQHDYLYIRIVGDRREFLVDCVGTPVLYAPEALHILPVFKKIAALCQS